MNNPNKLAWKGTKGIWEVAGKSQSGKHNINIVCKNLGAKFKVARVPFLVVDDLSEFNERMVSEAMADSHLISAAPEAVEFIADFLKELADPKVSLETFDLMTERAERIIKKAYNF